jgi:hypothetical protein
MHRRYSRKHKRNPSAPRHNPPLLTDLVEFVGPGFGGFAVSRFVTRAAATQIAKRAPSWGKHAGAVAAVGSFLAAWFLAHKVKFLEKYHTPIVVGSAIAGLQSLIQLYVPMLGWIVSDASPELAGATAQNQLAVAQAQATAHLLPTNEDPNEYTYNDSFDAGRYSQAPQTPSKIGMPAGPAPDDLAIDDAIGQSNLGVFSN